ncbi:imidazole glycerol phosphate synthase subunit HisH [Corynebacterium ulceribovis]|uniref:imidazole glycerol phosphate synthase subunit HisH n=1 Tax=Corynebacterium ulceribovis TaxID=487732 RepID=UPI00036A2D93|nr:imidazole glycerol phosphate synthase subunit HisH [Corynebacterium ulceribovis]
MKKNVVLLDYGSGNLRSAQRALEHVGADVTVTADQNLALSADGMLVPGVGAYSACMRGLRKVRGDYLIDMRLAGGRPVLGICVGMQVMFAEGTEPRLTPGCDQWPGTVDKLHAEILPHMGWNTVEVPAGTEMFAGLPADERFYFVHSYGARSWDLDTSDGKTIPPLVSWAQHEDDRFVAAVENGPLWATQFHPEKSGEAGLQLLRNWVETL